MSRNLYLFAFRKVWAYMDVPLQIFSWGGLSLHKRQHHLPQCQIKNKRTWKLRRLTDSALPYEPSTPPC